MKDFVSGALKLALKKLARVRGVLQLGPHDTSSESGRSRERYRRMALTSIASLVSRGIGVLATLVSIPLTFRYLGAERYGLWMVMISLISVMGFADLGIGNGVMNAVSEALGKDDRRLQGEYVASGFYLMTGIATLLALAGAVAFPFMSWTWLFNVQSPVVALEGARAFLVLYSWFVLSIPLGVVTRVQAGLQQAYWSQIVNAGGNIVSLLALVMVVVSHGSLPWLVFAATFGVIVATVINGWLLLSERPWLIPSPRAYRGRSAKKILKLGLMFFVLQCSYAVSFASDNVVIARVLGVSAVALYAVPQKLFSFVTALVSIGVGPLWPAYGEAIARGDFHWVRKAFFGSLLITLAVTIPICALLALAAPWILRVTLGKSLQAPMSLLVVLAVWGVVGSVSAQVSMLLNGSGALKEQSSVAVISSLCNLALSIFLTRRFGVVGVCLGSIIVQLVITLPISSWIIKNLFKGMARRTMQSENFALSVQIQK